MADEKESKDVSGAGAAQEASQVAGSSEAAASVASDGAAVAGNGPAGSGSESAEGKKDVEGNAADGTEGDREEEGAGGEDLQLFPLPVKGPAGEEIELQVNPADTVMDLKQFLADAPETCFYTCYDLILTKPDGLRYHLVDFVEIGEVADVEKGGCLLEMFNTFYDDRAVRLHVKKTRELISMAGSVSSASTEMACDYDMAKALATEKDLGGDGEEKEKEEKEKEKAKGKKDLIPELEASLGFGQDSSGVLAAVVPKGEDAGPQCIESISFSSFNPVPGHRRLQGDLLYLDIVTAEGKAACVTATTRGFLVNRSGNGRKLDPRPLEPKVEASTLIGLLRQLSPKFSSAFDAVMEKKSSRHPFENMTAPLPPVAWLAPFPPADHMRQVSRAEDALTAPFGIDFSGALRDWNEELQACRELPKATMQDRILRDRALYRVSCEFADAAVKGAKAVISRSIPPINPHDSDRFHMYVHNNIFFSFAVDGDFLILQQIREKDLKEQAEAEAKKKAAEEGKEEGVGGDDEKKGEEEGAKGEKREEEKKAKEKEGEAKEGDEKGEEEGAGGENAAAGAAGAAGEAEQASYASSNNDLKGTMAVNRADIPGVCSLAMAIVDYRGHRIIAQSIIPGILYGDRTTQMLYGSLDNGKSIKWSEKFHQKAVEVGDLLRIKEHKVSDSEGNAVSLCSPVETKGILGSDDRQYLLDLIRLTPRDVNFVPVESEAVPASSAASAARLAILRPELIDRFCEEEEVTAYMKLKKLTTRPSEEEVAELREKGEIAKLKFNPNVFTEYNVVGDEKEIAEDEALVRKAGEFLLTSAIPQVVKGLKSADIRPMDGRQLSEALHSHGVNLRYLGRVAEAVKEDAPFVFQLCVEEMVARATRHVLKAVLRETLDQDVGGAIAHFLNCLLGTSTISPPATLPQEDGDKSEVTSAVSSSSKKKKKGKGAGKEGEKEKEEKGEKAKEKEEEKKEAFLYVIDGPGYTRITAEMVWSDISEGVKFKYKFSLPANVRSMVRSLSALRNICSKLGVVLAAHDFNLNSEVPLAVGDILDLKPLVKFASPASADAEGMMVKGRRVMQEVGLPLEPRFCSTPLMGTWLRQHEAKLNEAFEVFSEAYQILQQICGPLHSNVAACCRHLALIFFHAGETPNAVLQLHRELIINERVKGFDHPDTIHSYGNLALFFNAMGEPELALRLFQRTLQLMAVAGCCSPPTIATATADAAATSEAAPSEAAAATTNPIEQNEAAKSAEGSSVVEVKTGTESKKKKKKSSSESTASTTEAAAKPSEAAAAAPTGPTAAAAAAAHPEAAALFVDIALTFQEAGKSQTAIKYLQAALQSNESIFGSSHLEVASCQHALALTHSSMGAYKLALQQERKAETIYEKVLGRSDARTKESEQWVQTFLDRELKTQKQQRVGSNQQVTAQQQAAAIRMAEMLKHRPDLLQALQGAGSNRALAEALLRGEQPPAAAAPPNRPVGVGSGMNPGLRGRGVDERAARAAAEARKKAAARGVNLRAPGAAASRGGTLDMDELLNFINNTPSLRANAGAASSASTSKSGSTAAPAGLGSGLGVGLGAVSGAPPTKGSSSGKKSSSLPTQVKENGDVKGGEKGPVGLGLGLEGGGKKGKGKQKKGSIADLVE